MAQRFLYRFLLVLFLAAGGFAGYDYYQTGSIDHTIWIVGQMLDSAKCVTEQAGGLWDYGEREVKSLLSKNSGKNVSTLSEIPEYAGDAYVTVNNNVPSFTDGERQAEPYEYYSELDALGRCGYAEAKISEELMPAKERGPIGAVKPSGWHTVKYDHIDGKYLYNRCHLIGYQLTGENANERNLITGTRYLNVNGMLPWENQVADYIRNTGDMVLYRVTPLYEGDNLVASGVQMEAQSLGSDKIRFNIFVFNVQPGICIDYASGESWEETGE